MKYVRYFISNGYAGCDYEEDFEFDDDITDKEIGDICNQLCYENAEIHADVWADQEDIDSYYENAYNYCSWSYITKEEFEGEESVY